MTAVLWPTIAMTHTQGKRHSPSGFECICVSLFGQLHNILIENNEQTNKICHFMTNCLFVSKCPMFILFCQIPVPLNQFPFCFFTCRFIVSFTHSFTLPNHLFSFNNISINQSINLNPILLKMKKNP